MKNFLKVIGILCSVSLLFTLFAGCGAKNPSESAGSPATSLTEPASAEGTTPLPNENITLRFSWWGGDARHEATLEALKLYTQKFPNVKVEGEYSGWDGYVQKLSTQIAGGSAPDIISIPDIEAYNLIKQGTLLDLHPYAAKRRDHYSEVYSFQESELDKYLLPVYRTGYFCGLPFLYFHAGPVFQGPSEGTGRIGYY